MNTSDLFRAQSNVLARVYGFKSATSGLDKLSEGTESGYDMDTYVEVDGKLQR